MLSCLPSLRCFKSSSWIAILVRRSVSTWVQEKCGGTWGHCSLQPSPFPIDWHAALSLPAGAGWWLCWWQAFQKAAGPMPNLGLWMVKLACLSSLTLKVFLEVSTWWCFVNFERFPFVQEALPVIHLLKTFGSEPCFHLSWIWFWDDWSTSKRQKCLSLTSQWKHCGTHKPHDLNAIRQHCVRSLSSWSCYCPGRPSLTLINLHSTKWWSSLQEWDASPDSALHADIVQGH